VKLEGINIPRSEYGTFDFLCLNQSILSFYTSFTRRAYDKCPKECFSCNEVGCLICNKEKGYYGFEENPKGINLLIINLFS
jgi:hypothetical protein